MRGPFSYDAASATYYDATGRPVPASEVRKSLDEALYKTQRRMLNEAESLRAGKMHLRRWRASVQKDLKDTHLYSAAAAKGGWEQMRAPDWGRVGRELRDQYEYLDGFVREIKKGTQRLDGSFVNRVRLYAQSGRKTYHKAEGVEMRRLGMNEERNKENPTAEHCKGCEKETKRGWVKIGTLKPIGDRDCLANDKCEIEYRVTPKVPVGDPLTWKPEDFPPANPEGIDSQRRFKRADGTYTPERQKLHDRIVEETLKGQKPSAERVINVLGGGPASGKSVTEKAMAAEGKSPGLTVDVDKIRFKLPEYDQMVKTGHAVEAAPYTHEESSDIAKQVQDRAIREGINFVADGTGDSGIEKLSKKIAGFRAGGAKIVARYVSIDTDEAVRRTAERTKNQIARGENPRTVPEQYLRDTHADVSRTFPEAVKRGIFDEFELWDNNGNHNPIKIAEGKGSTLHILNQDLYDRFLAKASPEQWAEYLRRKH